MEHDPIHLRAGLTPHVTVALLFATLPVLHMTAAWGGIGVDWLAPHVTWLIGGMAAALVMAASRNVAGIPGPGLSGLILLAGVGILTAAGVYGPITWGRLGADAAGVALLVMAARHQASWWLLGLSGIVMLLQAMVIGQRTGGAQAGLGASNALLAMAVPGGTAWVIWLLATRQRRRACWSALGIGAVIIPIVVWSVNAIPGYPRRGALLALGVACLAGLVALTPRPRRVLVGLVLVGMLALAVWWLLPTLYGELGERSSRWWYWRSAWDGIVAAWPWGGGAWSTFGLAADGNEAARISSAAGEPIDDPHNLALALLLDHGVLGLGFLLSVVVLVSHRIIRMADPADRAAGLSLMVAVAVVVSVDNCWSMPASRIWLWYLIGVLWACPVSVAPGNSQVPPQVRRLLLGGCGFMAFLAVRAEIPAVVLPPAPNPTRLASVIGSTCIPQVATTLLDDAAASPLPHMGGQADQLTALARERFGAGLPILEHRLMAARFSANAAIAMTRPEAPGRYADQVLKAWRQRRPQLIADWLTAAVEVVQVDPFRRDAYMDIAAAAAAGADRGSIPAIIAQRMRWLVAPDGSLPGSLATLDAGADAWAKCWGMLSSGHPEPWVQPTVGRLTVAHGRCSGVAAMAIFAIATDPDGASVWASGGGGAWNWGLRHMLEPDLGAALERVRSPAACRLLAPILDDAFGRNQPPSEHLARIQATALIR